VHGRGREVAVESGQCPGAAVGGVPREGLPRPGVAGFGSARSAGPSSLVLSNETRRHGTVGSEPAKDSHRQAGALTMWREHGQVGPLRGGLNNGWRVVAAGGDD
jgi:hypothetical protein